MVSFFGPKNAGSQLLGFLSVSIFSEKKQELLDFIEYFTNIYQPAAVGGQDEDRCPCDT